MGCGLSSRYNVRGSPKDPSANSVPRLIFPAFRKAVKFSWVLRGRQLSQLGPHPGNRTNSGPGPAPRGPFLGAKGLSLSTLSLMLDSTRANAGSAEGQGSLQVKPMRPTYQESEGQALLSAEIRKGRCEEAGRSWSHCGCWSVQANAVCTCVHTSHLQARTDPGGRTRRGSSI